MKQGSASPEFVIKKSDKNHTYIQGYASVFNILDRHNDMITKGAFVSSIGKEVKLLWQHDSTKPIGIITDMKEDDYGLHIEAEINNNTQYGFEAVQLIKQKAVSGLSIGFCISNCDYNTENQRVISDIDLAEISVVTFPANESAVISQIKSRYMAENQIQAALDKLGKIINQIIEEQHHDRCKPN